ncbi:TetR/AcrR family transcriptional regulator [Nocardioides sp. URHA0020]|uniref:TetR/AcrR family transcriptional regulator n=1 Tax=Nocardioides sp. URHA0020 TaxID=1380392 RepID=UPI00048B6476|nr:TetR/AcrR family transcriptional regulator [Nocardioides sp. URHA0020]
MPRPADPATRDRIVDAAGRLFYARGIRAVGMAEIVTAAGCGKNVLYRHFASKDELVLAYLQRVAGQLDPAMDAAVAGLDTMPSAALVAITREVADRATARGFRGCPFRNYLREMRDPSGAPGRFALTEIRALRRRVDVLVAALGAEDPDLLADRIWLLIEGLYASAPYGDRGEAATTAVGLVQELLAAA